MTDLPKLVSANFDIGQLQLTLCGSEFRMTYLPKSLKLVSANFDIGQLQLILVSSNFIMTNHPKLVLSYERIPSSYLSFLPICSVSFLQLAIMLTVRVLGLRKDSENF